MSSRNIDFLNLFTVIFFISYASYTGHIFPLDSNKIATTFDPIVIRSVRLSDLMTINIMNIKIMNSRRPLKVHQSILLFGAKLETKLSLEALDLHMLLSKKTVQSRRQAT